MAEMLEFAVNLSLLANGNMMQTVGPAAQKLSDLSSKMQKLNQTSRNIQGFQKQSQKLTELRAKLDAARTKVRDMQTVMRGGGQVDARLFTKANEEAAKLQEQVINNTKKLGEFRSALQGAGVDTSDLAGAQQKLQAQTEAMTRAQERLSAAQSRYKDLQSRLSLSNIKGDILGAVATFNVLKAPVKLAADFESAMARVKAVAFTNADADLSQFEAMKAQAAQLGADTKFTAIEAAAAQENLARSGMSAPDIMAAMPALLNMSSAEGMDIGTAGAIIAKGLGGMNLEGKFAGRLADILAYTSANSNTNISMLGEAFKAAAPVAASQNINMEQLASYLGIMANKGYEGGEAGNALSSSIQRLAKRPKQAAEALDMLGVATRTKSGKMRELPDIMIALNESMQRLKLGENQQLELMSKIFGGNYGAQMMAFMSATVAGDTERMQNGVYNDSFGRAEMMSNINLDTLNGQLAILGSAWDGVRTTIGDMFSPIIRDGVELLSAALSKLNELMKQFPNAAKGIAFALGGLGVAKVARSVWNIGSALLQLPGAWLEVARASSAAANAAGEVTGSVGLIGRAFSALKGLVLGHPLIIFGTLAAGAVYLAVKHWDTIKEWWSKFSVWFSQKWESMKNFVMSIDWSGVWNGIITSATSCVEYVKSLWQSFKDWILSAFDKLNPFNWEMPEWMKKLGGSSEQQVKNANIALGGYLPPTIEAPKKKNALGGIYSSPIWTWAAEAGPEAIIPLTNKSRGIPLIMQAAQALGVSNLFSNNTTRISGQVRNNSPVIMSTSANSAKSSSIASTSANSSTNYQASPLSRFVQNATQSNRVGGPSWMRNLTSSLNRTQIGGRVLSFLNNSSLLNNSSRINNSSLGGLTTRTDTRNAKSSVSSSMGFLQNSGGVLSSLMSVVNSFTRSSNSANAPSIREVMNNVNSYRSDQGSSLRSDNSRSVNVPAVNLTVNVASQEGQSSQSLAVSIADEVRKVLAEITSLEERVAFA